MVIKYFDTERQAIKYKKKLKGSKNYYWTVQGNTLVKISRRKLIKKLKRSKRK